MSTPHQKRVPLLVLWSTNFLERRKQKADRHEESWRRLLQRPYQLPPARSGFQNRLPELYEPVVKSELFWNFINHYSPANCIFHCTLNCKYFNSSQLISYVWCFILCLIFKHEVILWHQLNQMHQSYKTLFDFITPGLPIQVSLSRSPYVLVLC